MPVQKWTGIFIVLDGMGTTDQKGKRKYARLANAVTLVHVVWTIWLFVGIFAVLVYPPYAPVQLVVLTITVLINLPFGNNCPLTIIEEKLRREYNPNYDNHHSFATTYLNKLLGTHFETFWVNTVIVLFYIFSYATSILAVVKH